MKHKLLRSTAFVRAARKLIKKNPGIAQDLRHALERLSEDPFHPSLRTHKLKGQLANSWACSASYKIRLVFSFVEFEDQEASCWKPSVHTKRSINPSGDDLRQQRCKCGHQRLQILQRIVPLH